VLPRTVSISPLATFVANRLEFGVDTSGLALSPQLFGTSNFFESCEAEAEDEAEDETENGDEDEDDDKDTDNRPANAFLRWVHIALELPNGEIVLLAEREADGLLNVEWAGAPAFKLISMQRLNANTGETQRAVAASLSLFRGETMYPEPLLQGALKRVLNTPHSESIARGFVGLRGRHSCWDRSDLEKVATVFNTHVP
jgi:hypothetical protein